MKKMADISGFKQQQCFLYSINLVTCDVVFDQVDFLRQSEEEVIFQKETGKLVVIYMLC